MTELPVLIDGSTAHRVQSRVTVQS